MEADDKRKRKESVRRLRMSTIFLLLALAGVALATTAWFSISDKGKINTLKFDITTGIAMKFDLDAHSSIEQYVDTLTMSQIAARIKADHGFDMMTTPLSPVTTTDCVNFHYEDGTLSNDNKGDYLTFVLHFMAETDMIVHLSPDSSNGKTGTVISSKNPDVAASMRISFTDGNQSYVFDPGLGNQSVNEGSVKRFGLSGATPNNNNAMFKLTAGVDKAIVVHVWVEGNDEKCTNNIKGSDYVVSLKFKGTDENNNEIKKSSKKKNNKTKNNTEKSSNSSKNKNTTDENNSGWLESLKQIINKHSN